jgi:hypothetical protein
MNKQARWIGWRTARIEAQVVARAQSLAIYAGGSPETFLRYLTQVYAMIDQAERFPKGGTQSTRRPSTFHLVVGDPAPGSPDVLIYTLNETRMTILGEGTFSAVPPRYL